MGFPSAGVGCTRGRPCPRTGQHPHHAHRGAARPPAPGADVPTQDGHPEPRHNVLSWPGAGRVASLSPGERLLLTGFWTEMVEAFRLVRLVQGLLGSAHSLAEPRLGSSPCGKRCDGQLSGLAVAPCVLLTGPGWAGPGACCGGEEEGQLLSSGCSPPWSSEAAVLAGHHDQPCICTLLGGALCPAPKLDHPLSVTGEQH